MVDPSLLWQYFERMDLFGLALAPVLEILGVWFYALVWFILVLASWMKTRITELAMMLGIALAVIYRAFLPSSTHFLAYTLTALAMAGLLFKLFAGGRSE